MRLLRIGAQILSARAVQVAAGAGSGLIVARALGPAGQGHYSLVLAAAAVAAALVNGGVGLAAVPMLRAGLVSPRRVLRAQARWCAAAGAALALAALAAAAGPWARASAATFGWDLAGALAAGLGAAALLAGDVLFYDLLAAGRLVAGTVATTARAALQFVLLAALVLAGRLDLRLALVAFAVAQAGGALLLSLAVRGATGGASAPAPAAPARSPSLLPRLLREGWLGQLSAISSLLHLRLNLALLALWHGPAAVGIYSVATLVGELLWHLPGALSPVLIYSSAGAGPEGAGGRDRLAARALRLGLAATAAAAVPLAFLAAPLLPLVFGAGFAPAAPALRALLPGIVCYGAGAVLAGDFIGRGRPAWNAHASGLTLGVNALAGLLLVPAHGAVGAAWASTLAYAAGSGWMVVRFRRATGLGWRELFAPRRAPVES